MVNHTTIRVITAHEVEQHENQHPAREIIGGVWAAEGKLAGQKHNLIAKRVFRALDRYVMDNQLGEVYTDGLNYVLDGEPGAIRTMRIPDLSFVSAGRADTQQEGFYYLAPDLAVEVLSPSETPTETQGKIADYLRYGTRQVWVIDPQTHTLTVYQNEAEPITYREDDQLDGGGLLPGFILSIRAIFAE